MTYTKFIKGILRPYRVAILLFILLAFFLRIPILQVRFFDPDEFQHLHGARQIYYGEIPYRDYFDHHTPFLHFILSLLYPIVGEDISILFAARSLMMVFTAIILCLTYVLTRKLYDTDAGLLAALFLSYVLIFLEKTLEIRPDLPAVIFWLATLIFMMEGIKKRPALRWHVLSGVSMGIAIMFTQKTMFGLGGIFLSLIYPFIDRRVEISWKQNLRLILAFLGGISIPIILTCFFFLAHHSLWQFINCNFIMNSNWKVRFSPYGYIRQMLKQNPFFPVMGLAGLIVATIRIYKKDEILKGSFIPVFCAYSLIAGLFIIPVPYRQYYQTFLPLLAMYCALILKKVMEFDIQSFVSSIRARRLRIPSLVFTILILAMVVVALVYTLRMSKPSVPNLRNFLKVIKNPGTLYLILWIPFIVSAIITFIFKKRACAVMLISIGIIAHPLDQMINQFSQKNDGQLADIQYIMNVTSPSDAVLDGWSGYGFLRPHAYYYFFLHGEMRAMLSEKELSDDLIKSAEERNTKIVIYDDSIKALPTKTQEYINSNYVHSGQDNLYIRKDQGKIH